MRHHWTNAALLSVGLWAFAGQAQAQADCTDWNTAAFFKVATAPDVMRCLEKGADIDARGVGEWAPLHFAAGWGTVETMSVLLNAGADVGVRGGKYGNTPLHFAAFLGCGVGIVNSLLDAGADIEARDLGGETPLHFAVESGNPETVKALLNAGADREARNTDGMTPNQLMLKAGGQD